MLELPQAHAGDPESLFRRQALLLGIAGQQLVIGDALGTNRRLAAGLKLHSFGNYPDLAAWCRARLSEDEQQHFAMGHGQAFVSLIRFMRADHSRDIGLLAISRPGTSLHQDRLKCVIAYAREEPAPAPGGSDAVLLYEEAP